MTNSSKLILSFVFTFLITRGAFYFSHFNPTRDLNAIPGYSLDIAIWVIVMFTVRWVLNKWFPTASSSAA